MDLSYRTLFTLLGIEQMIDLKWLGASQMQLMNVTLKLFWPSWIDFRKVLTNTVYLFYNKVSGAVQIWSALSGIRYNYEGLCNKVDIWKQKSQLYING